MDQGRSDPEDTLNTTHGSSNKDDKKALLCYRCRSLDLTIDKFIIRQGSSATDIPHDPQRYEPKRAKSTFQVKSGKSLKHVKLLGKLHENSRTCQLCGLIYRTIVRYGKQNVNDETSCSLTWEVHGREYQEGHGFINKTRRIRLSWNEISGNQQEAYLMLVAPQDPLRPISDASAEYQKEYHFLGRGFGDQQEKQALMKSWIDICVNNRNGDHELCRNNHGTDEAFKTLTKQTYFGVIDVVDMQLKSLPRREEDDTPEPYVALSYVWGQKEAQPYRTIRRTVMTHILHGGLEPAWEKLPRTIQDGMLIVSRLGYRYLWIDSLCIVQDSKSSWQLNASAMHLVYGNAQFTICAADGADSSVGLRAANPVLRAMRPATNGWDTMASISDVDGADQEALSAECSPGVRLMVTRSPEAVLSDSAWSKRAWTFQERIISRRCLIFAEGKVYWQCRAMTIAQDIHTDGSDKGLAVELTNSPLRTLQQLQRRPLWSYMSYVRMYTGRLLTKQRDVLAAFDGVAWLLGNYMRTPFIFGLPASHFDLALLWGPLQALGRRRPGHGAQMGQQTCTVDELGNCTCRAEQESFGDMEFPTWAWAGWMGGNIEYQSKTLEGCLENVHEWLVHRTWIQWHIRDDTGCLQPLWDIIQQGPAALSTTRPQGFQDDGSWRGYPASAPLMARPPRRSEVEPAPVRGISRGITRRQPVAPQQADNRHRHRRRVSFERSNTGPSQASVRRSSSSIDDSDALLRSVPIMTQRIVASSDSRTSSSTDVPLWKDDHSPIPMLRIDPYGRRLRGETPDDNIKFHAILPDNPFGVGSRKTGRRRKSPASLRFMPILQFFTWRTELHVVIRDPKASSTADTSSTQLCQCDIIDKEGDWCGSIVLDATWIRPREAHMFTFIAISEAKQFTMEECPVWTYYIPKVRSESEWDLYYVLLLERNEDRCLWERVGMGKVFQAAFRDDIWGEIKLG
ncbi:HET-domain-containing protein [Aspergillus terreus]|uniref:HET-domain-containing protein n=1 Tax=Aspergillus terreus TaxID=33178 RepID=A0A5M3ZC89_ASPTE|nr:hypothetical protein ATETN484_0014023500 [Aspergillus terreus]GFF20901.1 HET-domain-containing protein [Aspergillus terreus]